MRVKMNVKKSLVIPMLALSLVGALLTGCSTSSSDSSSSPSSSNAQSTSAATKEKTLRVGIFTDFGTLNPAKSSLLIDEELYNNIYDPLIKMNKDGKLEPSLATKWTISDDGKTYTFDLRNDVKFHDGTPFNAQAVIDNWNWIMDPKNASARASDLALVQELSAPDPYKLVVKFKTPFSPFLGTIADRTGMISSPTAMKKYGADYDLHPVGTGPFEFVSWNKNDKLTIKKNPKYWDPSMPKVDIVEFKPISNPAQKLNALVSGDVDIVDSLPFQDIPKVEKTSGLKVGHAPSFGMTMFWLNNTKPPFNNVNNRRAINMAINRDEINQLIYYGNAVPTYSQFSPASWANDPNVKAPNSLDAVKAELAKAGNPDGFSFTVTCANDPDTMQLMQLAQSQLAKAGITMTLDPLDSNASFQKGLSGDFTAFYSWWSGMVDPDQNSFAFDTKGAFFNLGKYENPQVDKLLQAARESMDTNERKKLYSQVATIVNEEAGVVYVVHQPVVNAWRETVQGYDIYPDSLLRLGGVSLGQ
jgi:peptide/nickel transport system substrate-binding protein